MAEPLAEFEWERDKPLAPMTTLQAGGPARRFRAVAGADELAEICLAAQAASVPLTLLGWGSNVLVADAGIEGWVVRNGAAKIRTARTGEVLAETGCMLQDLFLGAAQAGLAGLSFAVGIPGTLGGALASNAGAYRASISDHIVELEVVEGGERKWVSPEWMRFTYRDSRLRGAGATQAAVLRVRFDLPPGDRREIFGLAREYQRQRIAKQPNPASAGSFFKNVLGQELANVVPGLPEPLRERGVVPAGFLIEGVGLKGFRRGAAAFGVRHANFILNLGGASAAQLRGLADVARARVRRAYGVELEEEVLYLGDWSGYAPEAA